MSVVPPRRFVTLKADRDTLWLLVAASGMTLALAYAVHNRPAAAVASMEQVAIERWAGELASPQPSGAASPATPEPLSSAALVVPKAAMVLPAVPAITVAPFPARLRPCERAPCGAPVKVAAAVPAPAQRAATPSRPTREASLADTLNPLNHIPDLVKRPFVTAGDTIAGWVRRF